MKVASFDIVFQEIPGEVTLALNLSNCPCHCPGCHSPHLAQDIGEPVTEELLDSLTGRYKGLITCVAFMGGDADPEEVFKWAEWVKAYPQPLPEGKGGLKTAWYSGRQQAPFPLGEGRGEASCPFDYVKLGPYIESLGGLKSPTTNQRLYKREDDRWVDITSVFWKKNLAD